MSSSKTDSTVFVKFPLESGITRFHLEESFGQVGPIKKCSVIAHQGYGFVRYVSRDDAQEAAKTLNGSLLDKSRLTVELASNKHNKTVTKTKQEEEPQKKNTNEDSISIHRKRTSRVIVRNLSFYANEANVKSVLQAEFGEIANVHLPRVSTKTHRGFCFVTFVHARDAQKAVAPRKTPLLIKKRPVAIDFSTPKVLHQQQKKHRHVEKESNDDSSDHGDGTSDDDSEGGSSSDNDAESDDKDGVNQGADEDKEDDTNTVESEESEMMDKQTEDKSDVSEGCTLFMRNLPFDATRHDVFQLFSRFGYITSIYLVKDKETGVAKGTAFCSFQHQSSAQKALDAAGDNSSGAFVTQRDSSAQEGLLYLNGRRILCNLAVDKQTAATLTNNSDIGRGKDRRNLYLKSEGRVANLADGASGQAWEHLPESDQLKRQRAFADKNTKLRSPLFFINPHRLSIRNLAKHVDEVALKKLCVDGIERGLQHNLVSQQDQVAHWRASGNVSNREVMTKLAQEEDNVIPPFDKKNVKQFIPSVYIDRDNVVSRGFGFVEFQHHAHALACLRELNNNPFYSAEYCAGGKKAVDARKVSKKKNRKQQSEDEAVRIPRLIVEFTVENKAKAKKQAEHRAQQQANVEKQKLEAKERQAGAKKAKKSRGKAQRERKRKQRESNESQPPTEKPPTPAVETKKPAKEKIKMVKPPKKRKVDKEEQDFENMVQSYKDAFASVSKKTKTSGDEAVPGREEVAKKRWFD